MKVGALEGAGLNHYVAIALGYQHFGAIGFSQASDGEPWCLSERNDWWKTPQGNWVCGPCEGFPHEFCSDWGHGGPIIERERIKIEPRLFKEGWHAYWASSDSMEERICYGPTPLIAAMRCFVASKLGSEVEDIA